MPSERVREKLRLLNVGDENGRWSRGKLLPLEVHQPQKSFSDVVFRFGSWLVLNPDKLGRAKANNPNLEEDHARLWLLWGCGSYAECRCGAQVGPTVPQELSPQ